ncbi:hypothetical protein ACB098_01G354200 [Castanea mollissima]
MQNFKSFGFELSIFALGTHGFQPELVAWEHTHGIHILYLYLTLKKQLRIKWPNNKVWRDKQGQHQQQNLYLKQMMVQQSFLPLNPVLEIFSAGEGFLQC